MNRRRRVIERQRQKSRAGRFQAAMDSIRRPILDGTKFRFFETDDKENE